jgi:hypothetical protein
VLLLLLLLLLYLAAGPTMLHIASATVIILSA